MQIVERSSGYWIVDEMGIGFTDPFHDLKDAIKMLGHIENGEHDWDADADGFVYCKVCGTEHPNNVPEWDTDSLQDTRQDLFNSNGTRKGDY